jgi:hypothetical protein
MPRRSWPRRHPAWTAILSVVAVVAVVGVVVAVVGSKPNGTSAGTSAASSPTSSAASFVTDPNGQQCTALDSDGYRPGDASPTPDPEANWEQNSPGYQSWLDVGSDVYQIGQDTNAGNELAMFGVNGDGFKLAEAAGAALQNPSPVDTRDYKKAMANFGFMGVSLTNGNINDADTFVKKALTFLQAWATAAQPGATGSSACGDWNLPQSSNCG